MNLFLQGLGGQPIFRIADEYRGRSLDREPPRGAAELLRRGQNLDSAGGVGQLGVRNRRHTEQAGENPFNNLHDGTNGESSR